MGSESLPAAGQGEARKAYERGDVLTAARIEANACERDGYDLTAAILRELTDGIEAWRRRCSGVSS